MLTIHDYFMGFHVPDYPEVLHVPRFSCSMTFARIKVKLADRLVVPWVLPALSVDRSDISFPPVLGHFFQSPQSFEDH